MLRLAIVAAIATINAAGSLAAQSQQPPSQAGQQNTAQEQRGTENAPIVVKVLPAEKSQDELSREDAQNKEKAATDSQLVKLTGDLALYTELLFIATAFLVFATGGLVRVGFLQVKDAKASIAAAVSAANAANAQVALGRDEFNANFRPHLVVRNIWSPNFEIGKPIEISYEITNIGDSDAIFYASSFEVHLVNASGDRFEFKTPPTVGENPPRNIIPHGKTLIPSQVHRDIYKPGGDWTDAHRRHGGPGQGFFWGAKILYRDNTGRQRRLGVFRKFDPDTRRFRPLEKPDPDYEYDD